MKDHLFIQSLEKDGQELLRGESAIGAAQWVGQQELELARTRALAPSKRKREVREGASEETRERGRAARSSELPPVERESMKKHISVVSLKGVRDSDFPGGVELFFLDSFEAD